MLVQSGSNEVQLLSLNQLEVNKGVIKDLSEGESEKVIGGGGVDCKPKSFIVGGAGGLALYALYKMGMSPTSQAGSVGQAAKSV